MSQLKVIEVDVEVVAAPTETPPSIFIEKIVRLDEPTANAGPSNPPTGLTDRRPHGVELPTPSKPVEVKVVVAVAPNAALDAALARVNIEVPVALRKLIPPVLNIWNSVVVEK